MLISVERLFNNPHLFLHQLAAEVKNSGHHHTEVLIDIQVLKIHSGFEYTRMITHEVVECQDKQVTL